MITKEQVTSPLADSLAGGNMNGDYYLLENKSFEGLIAMYHEIRSDKRKENFGRDERGYWMLLWIDNIKRVNVINKKRGIK